MGEEVDVGELVRIGSRGRGRGGRWIRRGSSMRIGGYGERRSRGFGGCIQDGRGCSRREG